MKEIIIDTLLDTVKIVPFLLVVFLFMEMLEHKFSHKSKDIIEKSGKLGPIFGSILGAIPQCGFSVAATNLYTTRIITYGTLIAVYLSTSDEMLPIMISSKTSISIIIRVIIIKIIIGMILGFLIDVLFRKKDEKTQHIQELCHNIHCGCEENLYKSVFKHTLNVTIFILGVNLVLNSIIYYVGETTISTFLLKNTIFEPFLTSLVGLIPNCGSSIIITELYLTKSITFGALLAGLLTNSGIALMVLFKENKNIKENIKIVVTMYLIGAFIGLIFNLLKI